MKKLILALALILSPLTAMAAEWHLGDDKSYIYTTQLGNAAASEGIALAFAEGTPVLRYMIVLDKYVPDSYNWEIEKMEVWIDNQEGAGWEAFDKSFVKSNDSMIITDLLMPDSFIDEIKNGRVVRVRFTLYDGQSLTSVFALRGVTSMLNKLQSDYL